MRKGDSINTYTGIIFWPLDPRAEEVSIRDIAHSLSMMCRANGHFTSFYSVAQHCVNCAREAKLRGMSERVQMACLIHDASEAYIADITRPVKKQLLEYIQIEEKLQNFIYQVYGIGDLNEEEEAQVKLIDDSLLNVEMKALMNGFSVNDLDTVGRYDFSFVDMTSVEEDFIGIFKELESKLK